MAVTGALCDCSPPNQVLLFGRELFILECTGGWIGLSKKRWAAPSYIVGRGAAQKLTWKRKGVCVGTCFNNKKTYIDFAELNVLTCSHLASVGLKYICYAISSWVSQLCSQQSVLKSFAFVNKHICIPHVSYANSALTDLNGEKVGLLFDS